MSLPDEPTLSWLIMERYVLGELSEAERRTVELGLASSEANRNRLLEIQSDRSELPELPVSVARSLDAARQQKARAGRGWVGLSSLLAAAAVVGLASVSLKDRPTPIEDSQATVASSDHTKGGEIALELVNEQGEHAPTRFAQGERFKVLVTCPPNFGEQLHLLVFQADERFEPLAPTRFACGNLLPWPGAFALDGEQDVEVCVAWGAQAASALHRGDLGDSAVCHALAAR